MSAGRRLVAGVASVLVAACASLSAGTADTIADPTAATSTTRAVPVFAYLYQWFTPSSWNRAKQDLPLAGKYSSDDPHVLRTQVEQARAAGIDGFLTSWKSTPALNRRLDLLIRIGESEHFDLGVVYEALDFNRRPLPVATVKHDMTELVTTRGTKLRSTYYGRPVIIWTGTDKYSVSDVQSVRAALGDRAYLLAAAKQVSSYERVAGIVDGEAYYWSSADPQAPATAAKLSAMSAAVHAHHGLWLAPAASGFDGRTLGGTRVIPRDNGQTLRRSLDNAFATAPDGVAVISWNEWSENTYIEPGHQYGSQEITVLQDYLQQRAGGRAATRSAASTHGRNIDSNWTGARAAVALVLACAIAVVGLGVYARHRSRRRAARHRTKRARQQGTTGPESARTVGLDDLARRTPSS